LALVHWARDAVTEDPAQVQVVVADSLNRPAEMSSGGFLQSRTSTPQVDLTLRNSGEQPVLLTKARITVEDSAWLPMCIVPGAGPVPIAGRYSVMLPFLPREGEEVVEKTLHDEVPANGIDRLKVYFQAPGVGEDSNLYAIHVELLLDGKEGAIDAGHFVIGVPGPPFRNGEVLPENDYLLRSGGIYGTRAGSAWCYRQNLSALHRILKRSGKRSPEIAALARFQPAKEWPSYSRGVTARAAIPALLSESGGIYGPWMAASAAEETGRSGLIAETRQRAAALLLEEAERSLGPEGGASSIALVQAHAAFNLVPSPTARALVGRAESAWLEVEEEQEEAVLQGTVG
jgi:hypothetical protein